MQTRTNRAQRAQLELFRPQSATIDWHQLPREIQQKNADLVREAAVRTLGYPGSPLGDQGE